MLPFKIQFVKGRPVYEQVLFAAKKAIICGQLKPGDPFPSVRVLSQELRINPNTAARAGKSERKELLGQELERLVVEAKKLKLSEDDLKEAIQQHWQRLSENK